jgi:RecJ-like exonuclease
MASDYEYVSMKCRFCNGTGSQNGFEQLKAHSDGDLVISHAYPCRRCDGTGTYKGVAPLQSATNKKGK